MRVETPQISWHGLESDRGRNAPLLSCSVIESGVVLRGGANNNEYSQVLATAGNDSVIHLWKLCLEAPNNKQQRIHVVDTIDPNNSAITHLLALKRHERSVNAIKFSPDGLVLATVGDGGSIVLWSVPADKRGGQNGRHFWSSVEKESDLDAKVVVEDGPSTEDLIDIAWAANSASFVVSCIDHSAFVLEFIQNKWKCVAKLKDHTHYVQGVAFDPLGTYLASQGSDRTVRVYSKKQQQHKKTTEPLFGKESMIKYLPEEEDDDKEGNSNKKEPKRYIYADETMVESFFRRLTWTIDGAFLITPAALWGDSFATLLFARHQFDQPIAVLSGHSKPSVVVKPCPVLFKLPTTTDGAMKSNLPYRSVFAVLTLDSVILYDTYHLAPLAVARGLHYANLTDCAWTCDGRTLIITSRDGYISFLTFDKGELGEVYIPPPAVDAKANGSTTVITPKEEGAVNHPCSSSSVESLPLEPAELSAHFIAASAPRTIEDKSNGKKRAALTFVSSIRGDIATKAPADDTSTNNNDAAVLQIEAKANQPKDVVDPNKGKKRIQPTLLTTL